MQVFVYVLSADQENDADVLGLTAASLALALSRTPWNGPVAGVRVGRVDGEWILNPTFAQLELSDVDMVVAGSADSINMVEGGALELPEEETQRRWKLTTPQWPIMHAATYGVSRDQMMARHKANHIQVAYATSAKEADKAMLAKAAMARAMGMEVAICGTRKNGKGWT